MKSILIKIMCITIVTIAVALLLGFLGFIIYVHIKFANVPIGEVPTWAVWIMFGGLTRSS